MSALAGIFNRRGEPPTDAELDRVFAPVRHRGPDHLGTYRSGDGFALSVALLVTTPEDRGSVQPVVEGGACLGFNGRIDNREELEGLLGPRQTPPERGDVESDAELALRAFLRWGDRFPARLVGPFALAVWQTQAKRLLLARDVSGQRTLLYFADATRVVFGSEIGQIVGHPAVPVHPNECVVAEYLSANLQSQRDTLYAGVRRVLPAHCLVFEPGSQSEFRYWDIDPTKRVRYRDDNEYIDHFRDTFRIAVSAQLRSSRAIGAQLSGGIDSSCVIAVANQQSRTDIGAYSLVFPGKPYDETPYIDAVTEHIGIPSRRFDSTSWPLADPLAQARMYRDVPDYPNTAMHSQLNRAAIHDGIGVLLTGEGADEFWSGSFGHAADLLARGHVLQSLRTCRWDSQVASFSYPRLGFLRLAVLPLLPKRVQNTIRGVRRAAHRPLQLLGPRLEALSTRESPSILRGASHAQQEAYTDLNNAWALQGNDTGCRFGGRFGLSQRAPFYDRRLLELAFAFPERLKKRRDTPKYAMRQALRGALPRLVLERRTKAEFTGVYTPALMRFGDRLRGAAIGTCGWVNESVLTDIYSTWRRDPLRHAFRLWMVLAIESWYKAVIA